MRRLVLFGLIGFAAQLIDGALGMAYGATSTTLLLSAGLAPAVASGTVHLAEIGTCLASGTAHWRFGNVDWRIVRLMALPGALGAFLGAVVLSSISAESAEPVTATILFALGVYVLLRFLRTKDARRLEQPTGRPLPWFALGPLGVFAGFMDAAGGGGWGPISTPALLSSGRMQPRKVIGSIDTSEFLVAVGASLGFLVGLSLSEIEPGVVAALLVAGVLAAPLAAWVVRLVPARILGAAVGGFICLTNAQTLGKAIGLEGDALVAAYVIICVVWASCLAVAVTAVLRAREDRVHSSLAASS